MVAPTNGRSHGYPSHLTPLAQAATYSDYDRYALRFWFILNYRELYITIDTGADTWYIRRVTTAAPYSLLGTMSYPNSNTRAYAEFRWAYLLTPYIWNYATLHCAVYLG